MPATAEAGPGQSQESVCVSPMVAGTPVLGPPPATARSAAGTARVHACVPSGDLTLTGFSAGKGGWAASGGSPGWGARAGARPRTLPSAPRTHTTPGCVFKPQRPEPHPRIVACRPAPGDGAPHRRLRALSRAPRREAAVPRRGAGRKAWATARRAAPKGASGETAPHPGPAASSGPRRRGAGLGAEGAGKVTRRGRSRRRAAEHGHGRRADFAAAGCARRLGEPPPHPTSSPAPSPARDPHRAPGSSRGARLGALGSAHCPQ